MTAPWRILRAKEEADPSRTRPGRDAAPAGAEMSGKVDGQMIRGQPAAGVELDAQHDCWTSQTQSDMQEGCILAHSERLQDRPLVGPPGDLTIL